MSWSISITLGWWMVPLALTLFLIGYLIFFQDPPEKRGDYDFASGFVALLIVGTYLFVIALIWLAYFIWLAIAS